MGGFSLFGHYDIYRLFYKRTRPRDQRSQFFALVFTLGIIPIHPTLPHQLLSLNNPEYSPIMIYMTPTREYVISADRRKEVLILILQAIKSGYFPVSPISKDEAKLWIAQVRHYQVISMSDYLTNFPPGPHDGEFLQAIASFYYNLPRGSK